MKKTLFSLLTAASMLASSTWAQATAFKVGDTIPATLQMTDSNGKTHTIGEFAGKPLVLEWTNYGCPFVRKHYDSKNMQTIQAATVAKGANWVSVISSAVGKEGHLTQDQAPAAISKEGFKGTAVVLDETGTLGQAFGASTTPHMFVLDAQGKLVYAGAIDSIASFSKEDIAKATNYVSQAVDEVLAGKPVSISSTKPYGCSVKY
jgi:hypothetical protein